MRLWRICRAEYQALDGEGSRLYGGRWTPAGYPVVHASGSASLAVLERLVYTRLRLGVDLVLVPIEVPETIAMTTVLEPTLSETWRQTPAPESLQRIGEAWLVGGETAVLQVPSALVPLEYNYLINPAHKDFRSLTAGKAEPFDLDPRLVTTS